MSDEDVPVKAVAKALKALEFVIECHLRGTGAGLTDIAHAVGVQNSTARNILRTLESCDYLARTADRKYVPGPRCLQIHRGTVAGRLTAVARQELMRLAERTGESAVLATLIGNRRQVLLRAHGDALIRVAETMEEGGSPYNTVTGLVLLAFADAEERALIEERWGARKDGPASDAALQAIVEQGFAIDTPGERVLALAVPVLDDDGRLVAAVGLHLPLFEGARERQEDLLREMRSCAAALAGAAGTLPRDG